MQSIKTIMLAAVAAVAVSIAQAQNPGDIVNKYIDAIGGKENLGKVNTLSMDGTSEIMGNEDAVKVDMIIGKAYKSVTDFNGQQFVRVYTDKGGWSINPFAGGPDPVALPANEYNVVKHDIYIGGALYNYALNHAGRVELEGTDGGAYKLEYTSPDSIESTYFIDTASNFLTRMVRQGQMQGQDVEVTTTFSDYRKTPEGVFIPYKTDIDFGGNFSLSTTVKKVELNPAIDPAIFQMPK